MAERSRRWGRSTGASTLPLSHGSAVALPTPFADGLIDVDTLSALAARQVDAGSSAIVVCGSTGEAAALSAKEYARAVEAVVVAVHRRIPVIAGCGAPCTATAGELAVVAACSGADALLCAPPPYSRPSQEGIIGHVRVVAHATGLPVLLYDVPSRSAVAIADATICGLFERGLIAGVKDATGDLSRPPRLRRLCGGQLLQLSGDDATALGYRAMGGQGCISVAANVAPRLCARLHRAWDAGERAVCDELRALLEPLHAALFADGNPAGVKAALTMLGLCSGDLRLPLTRATPSTWDLLADLLPAITRQEDAAGQRPLLALVR